MPRFILTADWHIRATRPRCRIDDNWIKTQGKALLQVAMISVQKDCDICVVGDVFHANSDTTFECIKMVQDVALSIGRNNNKLFVLPGNHDLLYHSSENLNKSAIGTLLNSANVYHLNQLSKEVDAPNFDEESKNKEIMFKHILCFPNLKSMPPNVNATTAKELLETYPKAKWIFTGDYHEKFIYENDGRYVVNSGCLLRQASDYKDYQPSVYFIDTDKQIIEEIPIIDEEQFVDDSYILKQEEREQRIESFVDKLKDTKNISLDFIDNVQKAITANKLSEEMVLMLEELLEV